MTALWLSAALSLSAQPDGVSICNILNDLISFQNRAVAVRGEVVGSFYHGFFFVPEGQPETCPNWPEVGFTRRAVIQLTFAQDEKGNVNIPLQFVQLAQMQQREWIYPVVTATLSGRLHTNRLALTYRTRKRVWASVGGDYPDSSVLAVFTVQRVNDWTLTSAKGKNQK